MSDTSVTRSRKYGLDFLKGIAACFVVFMHVRFPEPTGHYIAGIGTFAVPVFFMTSGYFSLNATRSKTLKSIKKTLMYLCVAYILNMVRIIVENNYDLGTVWSFLKDDVFTIDHVVRVILLSQSKISGVAWFLISLLMCYILKYILGRRLRYLGYLGIFIGVVGVLPPVCQYVGLPINNPWINGIPFFVIGECLADNKNWTSKNLSNTFLCVTSTVGLALLVIARVYVTQWWHIGTLLLSPALFVLFSRSDMKYNKVCMLGSVYAFFVYIMHPLVMHVYDALRVDMSLAESWLRPFIVLLVTILMAWAYYTTKHTLVKKK